MSVINLHPSAKRGKSMVKFFSKRRLKIAEQIIVVSFFAVIIPMTISGLIINNVNQHSNRAQLRSAAVMISKIVSEEIDVFEQSIIDELNQIISTLDYYNNRETEQKYLDTVIQSMPFYKELTVVNSEKQLEQYKAYNIRENYAVFSRPMKNNRFLVAVLDIETLKTDWFKTLAEDKRQIYVLDGKTNELFASSNYTQDGYEKSMAQLPKNLQEDTPVVFGKVKNQPLVYLKKTNPDALIIVNTTEDIKKDAIDFNRDRIILSILITMLTIFFVVGLYTYYLYINIRQLFKAIIAISNGNYARRIRLLTNVFTPFELVFLATEFNRMINQIHKSYIQINKKNKELN